MKENKVVAPIECPLCGDDMIHVNHKETHLYSCTACPAVLFEYMTDKDSANVSEHLKGDRADGNSSR